MDVYPEYDGDVTVLGIDQDPSEDENLIRRYAGQQGYQWEMAGYVGSVLRDYNIVRQAATVAIDGDGVITYRKGYFDGSLSKDDWREVLNEVTQG